MNNIEMLQKEGIVAVPYPENLRPVIARAVESWRNFCTLETATKEAFVFEDYGGYELKEETGETKDLKENFHVSQVGLPRLQKIAEEQGVSESIEFVESVSVLIKSIEEVILDFAKSVESEYEIAGFAENIAANKQKWTVRFLHYFGDQAAGEELASPHVDRGGFTLHLFESDSGLERLNWNKEWVPMPVDQDQTVIICGFRLQNHSENKLRAMCHRVVANESTSKDGRYSAVLFVNMEHSKKYDKDKFGRLQDFEPGFNYDIPGEKMAEMFTEGDF